MMSFIQPFVGTLISFVILDYIWLSIIMADFYNSNLGSLARRVGEKMSLDWSGVIFAYILLALGVVIFALPKIGSDGTLLKAFLIGGILGFIIYGVYDMTNLATLSGWSWKLSLADMIWGFFVTGVATTVALFVSQIGK